MAQKINQLKNGNIGKKIRKLRKKAGIGQTKLVRRLHLQGITITKVCLVKIERGIQHIQVDQFKAIKEQLHTKYDELLSKASHHIHKR